MGGGKKFAVLQCAEDSDYIKKRYNGNYGLFVELLAEEGETWKVFEVAKGEYPDDDEIGEYYGFVITGSASDAHGFDGWIKNLISFLKKLDSQKKKVLGVCFGHQILCRALGGRTERSTGFDIGVTSILPSISSLKLFASLNIPNRLSLIEFHQDEVRELPPNAEVMAWSDNTRVQMFRYGDHMMGIQGHPEYNKGILLHLIEFLMKRGLIKNFCGEKSKEKLREAAEPDNNAWKKLFISFLKGKNGESGA